MQKSGIALIYALILAASAASGVDGSSVTLTLVRLERYPPVVSYSQTDVPEHPGKRSTRRILRELFIPFAGVTVALALALSAKPNGNFVAALPAASMISVVLTLPAWVLYRLLRFAICR
jgi:hypothetical protein